MLLSVKPHGDTRRGGQALPWLQCCIYEMAVEAFVEISVQLLRFRPSCSNSSIWIC
jgi:hypothetical protein